MLETSAGNMNVVVVVVDALRASDVGWLVSDADTTPNLDTLAEDAVVFENAFAVSNYTDVCMTSILSGRMPREHGVTHHGTAHTEENLRRIEQRSPTFLPEVLQASEYETIGVDWMGRWHEWGYDSYGVGNVDEDSSESPVDRFVDSIKDAVLDLPDPFLRVLLTQYYRHVGYNDFRVNCEELTDIAIDRIASTNDQFFTLLHYWDVHPPYLPPDDYVGEPAYAPEDEPLSAYFGSDAKGPLAAEFPPFALGEHTTIAESKAAYDGAIRWVDEHLARLIEYLRKEGLFEETLFVLTADHGHNFGEHGIFSDNCGLYDSSLHVPLLVHDPTKDAARVEGMVQHTDIVPTVLDRLDLEHPDGLRGNVLPETRKYAFAEAIEHRMQMIRTTSWKLIRPEDVAYLSKQYWWEGDGSPELYDLRNDPGETVDIADEHPEVVRDLQMRLDEELEEQEAIARSGGSRDASINEDDMDTVKARLNALGYADDDNV